MGSPVSEAWREQDETSHLVKVANFRLAPREVTQEEYQRVTGKNPARFRGAGRPVEKTRFSTGVARKGPETSISDNHSSWISKGIIRGLLRLTMQAR